MSPEEMSFRNLVEWHKDNLVKLLEGTPASDIFTEHHHSYLVKHGVLCRNPNVNRTQPTPEAVRFLENCSSNRRMRGDELIE